MTNKFTAKATIIINASISKVWDALVTPDVIKKYFFGTKVVTDWQEGSPITFIGEWDGNKYEEKGILLQVKPENVLQYTHWSNLEGLHDVPENYRTWTFSLSKEDNGILLSVSEDNIPTEKQQKRSDEFWNGVLLTIKNLLENDGTEQKRFQKLKEKS